MNRLYAAAALILLLPLAGCLSDQKKQLANCEADAARTAPNAPAGQWFRATQSCMEQKGYRFIGWNDGVVCDMADLVKARPATGNGDAMCFEPKGWLALKLYRLEVPSRSAPPQT